MVIYSLLRRFWKVLWVVWKWWDKRWCCSPVLSKYNQFPLRVQGGNHLFRAMIFTLRPPRFRIVKTIENNFCTLLIPVTIFPPNRLRLRTAMSLVDVIWVSFAFICSINIKKDVVVILFQSNCNHCHWRRRFILVGLHLSHFMFHLGLNVCSFLTGTDSLRYLH